MRKFFILTLILATTSAFAQKNVLPGQAITPEAFNSSTLSLGSIQHSMLTPTQFTSLNGACWKLMDGSSIVGSQLATLTGMTTVPDARAMFFRGANNGRTDGYKNPQNMALGQTQNQDWKDFYMSNNNWGTGYNHGWNGNQKATAPHTSNLTFGGGWAAGGTINWYYDPIAEVRPNSITVNYFIKINNTCE